MPAGEAVPGDAGGTMPGSARMTDRWHPNDGAPERALPAPTQPRRSLAPGASRHLHCHASKAMTESVIPIFDLRDHRYRSMTPSIPAVLAAPTGLVADTRGRPLHD